MLRVFCVFGIHAYEPYRWDWIKEREHDRFDYPGNIAWRGTWTLTHRICKNCNRVKTVEEKIKHNDQG